MNIVTGDELDIALDQLNLLSDYSLGQLAEGITRQLNLYRQNGDLLSIEDVKAAIKTTVQEEGV